MSCPNQPSTLGHLYPNLSWFSPLVIGSLTLLFNLSAWIFQKENYIFLIFTNLTLIVDGDIFAEFIVM